ncbi:MAG: peptidylprolyl isomerase [Acutalibacteraceae bacterium]|nr:peptidylprolyl isomerase [Acutalibacteraceae bacterium]
MLKQLSPAATGDTVAVMHTTMGDITIKLFGEEAPKTVENFTTHAKNGYYDGIIFHRVIKDFMIQGGDPTGTGMGGESIWGTSFEDEFTPELHNYRGALCMANAGPNTNGSQFFIVQADIVPANMVSQMKYLSDSFPPECVEAYEKLGGTPWLDYRHSVFGQVCDGMDVVDAIANAKTGAGDKPVEEISIVGIDIKVL